MVETSWGGAGNHATLRGLVKEGSISSGDNFAETGREQSALLRARQEDFRQREKQLPVPCVD